MNQSSSPDLPRILDTDKIFSVSGYEIQRIIYKIKRVLSYLPTIETIPLLDYKSKFDKISTSVKAGQMQSIVSHMQKNELLLPPIPRNTSINTESDDKKDDDTTLTDNFRYFIEFGCDTATFSDLVSRTVTDQQQQEVNRSDSSKTHVRYVLIDQKLPKSADRCCDGRIRSRHQHMNASATDDVVQRLTCPISQIQLYDIIHHTTPDTPPTPKQACTIVAMAKNICGSGTDDVIRCVQKYRADEIRHKSTTSNATSSDNLHIDKNMNHSTIPLVLAPCCHHNCEVQTLLDYKFTIPASANDDAALPKTGSIPMSYLQYIGFDERDIEVLTIASQWNLIKQLDDAEDVPDDNKTAIPQKSKAEPSLFHNNLTHVDVDTIAPAVVPERDEKIFPPPLPPHPMPTTIPADLEANMRRTSSSFEEEWEIYEAHELGRYSKMLIDMTRLYYLRYNDICPYQKVQLIYYTTLSIERHLLIAT